MDGRIVTPEQADVVFPTDVTGVREAYVSALLVSQGRLRLPSRPVASGTPIEGWFVDPYDNSYDGPVLRSIADSEEFDGLIPDHPLSRLRRTLRDLGAQMTFVGWFERPAPSAVGGAFVYPRADRIRDSKDCVVSDEEEMARRKGWFDFYTRQLNVFASGDGPYSCPCCGHRTLDERGSYDICAECGWEDDGQDDHDSHVVRGGPNGRESLDDARAAYVARGRTRQPHAPPSSPV